ncbi:MAG: NrdH-redoxin [Ectothiorhodospiraceae bacterium]|nr:NrdH-redoxin [Chromatiales bacterium]MCP5157061.1 NrdH-redoxin [Ectothiorhodospiraceae bacterium]
MPQVALAAWILVLVVGGWHADVRAEDCDRVEVFVRAGCPHCAHAKAWLEHLSTRRPELRITVRDVVADPAALAQLREASAAHGITRLGVPTFRVCDQLVVGFDTAETTGRTIESLLAHAVPAAAPAAVHLPVLGALDVDRLGLPLFTVAVGLADGFNPCATWVLLFLLSLLVGVGDRRKVVTIAGTFVVVSGLVYFAFMAAWLEVFLLVGYSRQAQVAVGMLALAIAVVNVKDFVAFGRGPSLAIPERARPGLFARMRAVATAPGLAAALVGAGALAVLVNLVELLCTAGLPALYTQVLALEPLSGAARYGYLALYNVAYMADDAVLLALAVVTMRRFKLQERGGRWLKLVSGLLIGGLGAVLLARPQWLG